MFYGIIFLLFAVWSAYFAVQQGGLSWLLLWPAGSFALVSAAYLGLGPRVFGKRNDGRMNPVCVLLLLPFLALNWLVWRMQQLSGEPCWNGVVPGLFLGRRAQADELPPDISLLVDLTAEFCEPRDVVARCTYFCLPTLDNHVPGESEFCAAVEKIVGWSGGVFIHCAMGHGRSAMLMVAVLLARHQAESVEQAEILVQAARPSVRLRPVQRRMLERLYERR
jgi:protein-tyrosine phosphatase